MTIAAKIRTKLWELEIESNAEKASSCKNFVVVCYAGV